MHVLTLQIQRNISKLYLLNLKWPSLEYSVFHSKRDSCSENLRLQSPYKRENGTDQIQNGLHSDISVFFLIGAIIGPHIFLPMF